MTIHRRLALACLAAAAVTRAADETAVPPVAAAPPPAEAAALPRSAFVAGAHVGLLVPLGRATSDLSMTRYALLMSGIGLDLGWRPTRDVWLGAIGSAWVCFTCEDTGQDLYRAGAAIAVRALRLPGTELDDVSLWVGAGVAEAWLQAEPVAGPSRRVRGPELTLPRLELHVAQRGMRFVAGLEVTVGRFTHDYSPGTGHALAPSERTVHGAVELSLRAAFEGAGPAEPPPAPGRGFLLAGGLGVGVPLAPPGSSVAFVAPVTLAIGYRFGPRVRASAVLDVALGAPGGCAPATGCEVVLARSEPGSSSIRIRRPTAIRGWASSPRTSCSSSIAARVARR
jgi:hypothetical protein